MGLEEKPEKKASGGTQAVDRALALLRLVAGAPAEGLRLSDLAEAGGLDRATTHRLLSSLLANDLVDQDAATKRYTLGLDFFTLAAAASNRYDVAEISREALRALSAETGDTATLCLRSGLNLVCIDLETGSFPIKALPMDIGSRRPLGAGASGIAFLSALPDFEMEQVLKKAASRLADAPNQDPGHLRTAVALARAQGYALAAEEPLGRILGLAVTLTNRRGRPQGTLALSGIPDRFAAERTAELVPLLTAQARAIDEAMCRMPDADRHRHRWAAGLDAPRTRVKRPPQAG